MEHIDEDAFFKVCCILSEEHKEVVSLTPLQIYECDKVVRVLNLDKFRARYFARSRANDQTYQYYDLLVTELPQLSLDKRNESSESDFKQRVVLPDARN